ncbi:cyclic nucleotide-binding domain-containing protein [Streptomyces sp. NPDC088725]|uniref:cyclic nucleotide-binding domain-containing protein n=1 Tax=Streptomyces sp. NPDC088725 TaxID=3365873 RepID=UPI003819981D
MTSTTRLTTALPRSHGALLMDLARDVSFPADTRIFEEGSSADRFWIIHTGTVAIDLYVPDRGHATVEMLGAGDLLGWSWLFSPHEWHFGAEAFSLVRAYEFEAAAVQALCESDPGMGFALACSVAEILAHRLEATRAKLLDQYMVHGGPGLHMVHGGPGL